MVRTDYGTRMFDDSSCQRPFISTASALSPCTLPRIGIQVLVSCCTYLSSWPFLPPCRDSESLLSAIQSCCQLGQLFEFIPKFLQHLRQNSIQIKKWTPAFFPNPHTSVAESSWDTKYQEGHFFPGVLWPMSYPGWFVGWVGCTADLSYYLRCPWAASCLGCHSFMPTSVIAKTPGNNNIFNRMAFLFLRRP